MIERIKALEAEVNDGSGLRLNYNVGVIRAGDWASSVPGGVRARGAPRRAAGRGSRRGQGSASRPPCDKPVDLARLPRPRLRDRPRTSRSSTSSAAPTATVHGDELQHLGLHRHDRRARVRRPRTTRPPPVTARSAPTCTRPTNGSTSRASRTPRSSSRSPRRPGAAADRPPRARVRRLRRRRAGHRRRAAPRGLPGRVDPVRRARGRDDVRQHRRRRARPPRRTTARRTSRSARA